MKRSRMLSMVLVMVGVLAGAQGAWAAPSPWGGTAAGQGAVAVWVTETDDRLTLLFADGFTGADPIPYSGGGLEAIDVACENDQLVIRDYYSDTGSYTGTLLDSAHIATSGPLQGDRYAIPGCEDPDVDAENHASLGSIPVTLSADLIGQGDHQPYLDSIHFSAFPDCLYAGVEAGVERAASATFSQAGSASLPIDLTGVKLEYGGLAAGGFAEGGVDDELCGGGSIGEALRGQRGQAAHRQAVTALASRLRSHDG